MTALSVSTDPAKLDIDFIYQFLSTEARWCLGIPRTVVEKALNNSLCFGVYDDNVQVGFARVVTDYATFGNLVDVFVIPDRRGQGIARMLLDAVVTHPDLFGLRRFTLATSDKHELYRKFGFTELGRPEIFMEIFRSDVYKDS
ncbi:GNAT family N-acetyltransferase [Reinekea sp. G2M2-21]|uniref:GNAT family N-acetyltransferase n=1 Tax=Reinekea sp. G2M2-21 TaxID=2788942 RepID=UPI0018AAD9EF|nr:GNAT family N-acetyltransferase [Reinekea sp. G2M2-21]